MVYNVKYQKHKNSLAHAIICGVGLLAMVGLIPLAITDTVFLLEDGYIPMIILFVVLCIAYLGVIFATGYGTYVCTKDYLSGSIKPKITERQTISRERYSTNY